MIPQLIARLFFILGLLVLCDQYDCASYKQLLHNRKSPFEGQEKAAKLVRVQLSRSKELDSFEALSRSHEVFNGKSIKERRPVGLNSHLVGKVGIGSPAQEFRFIFETTYSNMWISSLNCSNCGDRKRYNHSASRTYIEDGTYIQTGWDHGFRSIDQISLGDIALKNVTFAEMLKIGDFAVDGPYDGLFCLGFDFGAQEDVVTPLKQMVNQNLISYEAFSIYQNSTGGEIVFGGVDESHFKPPINWLPSADLNWWSFRMDSVTLKRGLHSEEVVVCSHGCKFNIHTYIPYIRGPPEDVRLINEAIGAEVDEDDDSIFVLPNCDLSKLPNLEFMIGYDAFELTPSQYVQKVKKAGNTICVSSLHAAIPYMYPNEWFIGSSVIGHIYTVFHPEHRALGFAHTK